MTYTQQREADRRATQERLRRIRAVVASELAKDVPAGTAPVLDQPATVAGGAGAGNRAAEVPELLRGARPAAPADEDDLDADFAADRTTRRVIADQPTTPAAERSAPVDPGAAWEVDTPGGPVLAAEPQHRRPEPPAPVVGGAG